MNQEKDKNPIIFVAVYVGLAAMFFALFWKLIFVDQSTDFVIHNLFAQWILDGDMLWMNPGYHYAMGALSFLTGLSISHCSVIILTLAEIGSVYLSYRLLKEITGKDSVWVLLLAVVVIIAQPIFFEGFRPGYSSGNGYISPTQIACKPFTIWAIWIFYRMYREDKFDLKRQIYLFVILLVSCLVKPLFAMAFVPATGIVLLIDEIKKYRKTKSNIGKYFLELLLRISPLFFIGLFMIFQYWFKMNYQHVPYETGFNFIEWEEESGVRIGFLNAWRLVTKNVPLNILFAYFFPTVLLVTKFIKKKKNCSEVTFYAKPCLAYFLVSLAYMVFLYEAGGSIICVNFRNAWVVAFNYVFIWGCAELIHWVSEKRLVEPNQGVISIVVKNKNLLLITTALGVHVLFGLALLAKNFIV